MPRTTTAEPEPGPEPREPRPTLTIEETAEWLGVGRSTAYSAARAGQIPTIRVGRRLLVPRARLMALLGIQNADGPAAHREAVEVHPTDRGERDGQ